MEVSPFLVLREDAVLLQSCEDFVMSNSYLVVGLGNIGAEYAGTRHNMGFMVLDAWAAAAGAVFESGRYGSRAEVAFKGRRFTLIKPSTYMNLSGESIRSVVDFYKADPSHELIVIYDDVNLDTGQLRIREKGSAGGHNGIKNIIAHLGTQVFPRIRVGVGEKPPGYDLADYVLGHFSKAEQSQMEDGFDRAADAARMIVAGDIGGAMSRYNRKME